MLQAQSLGLETNGGSPQRHGLLGGTPRTDSLCQSEAQRVGKVSIPVLLSKPKLFFHLSHSMLEAISFSPNLMQSIQEHTEQPLRCQVTEGKGGRLLGWQNKGAGPPSPEAPRTLGLGEPGEGGDVAPRVPLCWLLEDEQEPTRQRGRQGALGCQQSWWCGTAQPGRLGPEQGDALTSVRTQGWELGLGWACRFTPVHPRS